MMSLLSIGLCVYFDLSGLIYVFFGVSEGYYFFQDENGVVTEHSYIIIHNFTIKVVVYLCISLLFVYSFADERTWWVSWNS